MKSQNVLSNYANGITTIIVNRPQKLNALNKSTINQLHVALTKAKQDDNTKVVIITGSGEKAFVAGADISEFSDYNATEAKELAAIGQKILFSYIANFNKPVIAAVNGFALGGGLELALACHIRVASYNAKMGLPEVSLGLIPGYGGTQRLTQLVGKGKAIELITTAAMINADEALAIGLVNHVTEQNQLVDFCVEMALKIMRNSPVAVSKAIEAIEAYYQYDLDGYEFEINKFAECFETEDFKEGTLAFLQKRQAKFKGK